MQEAFPAANNSKTIKACQKLINAAKENNEPILFVEFKYCGATLKELTTLTEDYSFVSTIEKDSDSGANEIENFFTRCRIRPKHLVFAGVNTDLCVRATILDLLRARKYNISLVKKACNSDWPDHERMALSRMEFSGVEMI